MSTYRPAVIVEALKGVLEGTLGAVRTVPRGRFKYGNFEGAPDTANHAKALTEEHRFDVKVDNLRSHASTPVSNLGPSKRVSVDVTIDIWTKLRSTAQETERDEQRAKISTNAELAIQALTRPNNLLVDEHGIPTGIVSGLLFGPDLSSQPVHETVLEDWPKHMHRSRIRGTAVVTIGQFTT